MKTADSEVKILRGHAAVFRHPDDERPEADQVWILWAMAGTGEARVEVPVRRIHVRLVQADGSESITSAPGHQLRLELNGDRKMPPPVLVLDRGFPE